ncbi:MAG: Nramp family divalent metal transporter [Candidatus Latescibacterota bacterium]
MLGNATKETVRNAAEILDGRSRKGRLRNLFPFLGPAFIASIAYVDPGNYATNIQAGAKFGYTLLWVVVASNLMAMLLQLLSAKLGIATGLNLAEHCRNRFPYPIVICMWVLMEIAAMATDLAEFIGAAIGFNLLLGIPLLPAGILTAVITFVILGLERYGFRSIETAISIFVGIVAVSYLAEIFFARPDWNAVFHNSFTPHFAGTESAVLAVGILGATVMPHAIFLHSALTQGRIVVREEAKLRRLLRFETADVIIAMTIAGLVNIAMLIMAASTFFKTGMTNIGTLEEAHRTLTPLLGAAAGGVFAISLLASGLSSSSVGTMAGQVIMQGFIRKRISPWIRRLLTMLPSLAVIAIGFDPTRTLVISQVVLSFGLPFAVIPLVLFTRRSDIMGVLVNSRLTTAASIVVTALIVFLNFYLIYSLIFGG